MNEINSTQDNAASRSSVEAEFQHLAEPYQHELLVHCYRILASMEDAEDALQETMLRAWRRLDSLKDPSAMRAWLYKIATNVSLDMLDNRKKRSMPNRLYPSADPRLPLPAPINDPIWIDPLPDWYLGGQIPSPEARYEARESVTLAFLIVLQELPGRQRAVLILHDVLGWKAQEVAALLDITIAAVNSSLQRARATLKKNHYSPKSPGRVGVDSSESADLLVRYVEAWETADSARLTSLLREDAILSMPPVPAWYQGRNRIKEFLDSFLFKREAQRRFRLVATRANGCPAFAVYQLDDSGSYQPAALQILIIEGGQIVRIDDFLALDEKLFARFKLPGAI